MLKKLVLFLAAVMLLASNAQAVVNKVVVGTTAPILPRETCGRAGNLEMVFEEGTVLDNATRITGTLPGGEFCQPIDLFINATAASLPNDDTVGPLQGNGTITNAPFILHVVGAGNTLKMEVKGSGSVKAGKGGLKLLLFDGKAAKTNDELLVGNWNGSHIVDRHNDTAAANTMCVKSASTVADGQNLILSLASAGAVEYSFHPATPGVAVIQGEGTVSVVKAKSDAFMRVPEGEQKSCSFSYEADACDGPLAAMRSFALKNGADYPAGDYSVEMEILVNGAGGDNGVYFEAPSGGFQFADDIKTLRGVFNSTVGKGSSDHEYFLGSGAKTTKTPVGGCERRDDEKITRMAFRVKGIDAALSSKDYLRVNVPSVAVTKAVAGDAVALKITVREGRCSVLYSGTYQLFTMVDKCRDDAKAAGSKLVFPYFADAPYWNGMALTNTGAAPVNATLAIVDAKGGEGTINVTVPAKGMYVDLVENIIANSAFNGTVNAKERCYIIVTPESGNLKGFAMMGNAGESMGYTVNN